MVTALVWDGYFAMRSEKQNSSLRFRSRPRVRETH